MTSISEERASSIRNPLDKIDELVEIFNRRKIRQAFHRDDYDTTSVGEGPSSRKEKQKKASFKEDPYELTFTSTARDNSVVLGPTKTLELDEYIKEDKINGTYSEHLRRNCAGKKRVGFVEPDHTAEANCEPASRKSDVTSVVLNELAHDSHTQRGSTPSSDNASITDDAPSLTEEDTPFTEGDSPAPYASSPERTYGTSASAYMSKASAPPKETLSSRGPAQSGRPTASKYQSKFFEDLGSDLEDPRPRYVQVSAREFFGRGTK
jgi:hypothetical protein